jgi:signal transduction histidine kinase
LARRYASILCRYLANGEEAVLEEAYALGRWAVAHGLGILKVARVHHQVLEKCWHDLGPPQAQSEASRFRAAETFLLEALSPFEITHRGFRETNQSLKRLIRTLEKRNVELAAINRELQKEITGRKRTERALRESEKHFRDLFNDARQMEENLRSLANQVLSAQEEERKRISRELHDEVGQALTAVSVTLATLKSSDLGASGADTRLTEAQRLLRSTMEIVHNFARELRPSILDELGLLPALRSYLNGFAALTGLKVRFQCNNAAEQLGPERKIVLFRIVQESLTNVAKHAEASQVAVSLRKVGNTIAMEVADNGKSFQADGQRLRGKRLGLLGMQERVRLVDGKFSILARPAVGTKVRVVVPLEADGSGSNKTAAGRNAGRFSVALGEHRQSSQQNVQSRS